MLAESVHHTIKKVPALKKKYEQLKETKGTNKARVTAMRKLLTYVYCVLSQRRPFEIRSTEENNSTEQARNNS